MIGHDTERRLTALLQERAEAVMGETDTRAAHDLLMVDQQDDPGPDLRRLVATAVAAAGIAAAGVVVLWSAGSGGDRSSPDPAGTPDTAVAVAVADAFVHAIAAKNPYDAAHYVAPGHEPWEGWRASVRRDIAWQARYRLRPCEIVDGPGPGTRVDCPYTIYFLSSAEAGAGPFADNVFKVQVLDGKVVWAESSTSWAWDTGSGDYLDGLRSWIDEHHPSHADFLGTDARDLTHDEWTPWTNLWRQYAAEYAAAQG